METRPSPTPSAPPHQWTIAELQAGLDILYSTSPIRAFFRLKKAIQQDSQGQLLKEEQVILSQDIHDEDEVEKGKEIAAVTAFSFRSFFEGLHSQRPQLAPKKQGKSLAKQSPVPHVEEIKALHDFTEVVESFAPQELMANSQLTVSLYFFIRFAYEKIIRLFIEQERNKITDQELLALTVALNRLVTHLQKGSQTLCLSEHKLYFMLSTLMLHIRLDEQDKINVLLIALEGEVKQFLDLFQTAHADKLIPDENYLVFHIGQCLEITDVNIAIAKPLTNKPAYRLINQLLEFANPIYQQSVDAKPYTSLKNIYDRLFYVMDISDKLDDHDIKQLEAHLKTSPPETVGFTKSEKSLEKLLLMHLNAAIQQADSQDQLNFSHPEVLSKLNEAMELLLEKNLQYSHFKFYLTALTLEGQKMRPDFLQYSEQVFDFLNEKGILDNLCEQLKDSTLSKVDPLRDCSQHIFYGLKLADDFRDKKEYGLAEKVLKIAKRLAPATRGYLNILRPLNSVTKKLIEDKKAACNSIDQKLQALAKLSAHSSSPSERKKEKSPLPTTLKSKLPTSKEEKKAEEPTSIPLVSSDIVNRASPPKAPEVASTLEAQTVTPLAQTQPEETIPDPVATPINPVTADESIVLEQKRWKRKNEKLDAKLEKVNTERAELAVRKQEADARQLKFQQDQQQAWATLQEQTARKQQILEKQAANLAQRENVERAELAARKQAADARELKFQQDQQQASATLLEETARKHAEVGQREAALAVKSANLDAQMDALILRDAKVVHQEKDLLVREATLAAQITHIHRDKEILAAHEVTLNEKEQALHRQAAAFAGDAKELEEKKSAVLLYEQELAKQAALLKETKEELVTREIELKQHQRDFYADLKRTFVTPASSSASLPPQHEKPVDSAERAQVSSLQPQPNEPALSPISSISHSPHILFPAAKKSNPDPISWVSSRQDEQFQRKEHQRRKSMG